MIMNDFVFRKVVKLLLVGCLSSSFAISNASASLAEDIRDQYSADRVSVRGTISNVLKISVKFSSPISVDGNSITEVSTNFIEENVKYFGDIKNSTLKVSDMTLHNSGSSTLVYEKRINNIPLNRWKVLLRLDSENKITGFSSEVFEPSEELILASDVTSHLSREEIENIIKSDFAVKLGSSIKEGDDVFKYRKILDRSAPYAIWEAEGLYVYRVNAITGEIISSYENKIH